MKKQTLFNLTSMPKMILVVTLIVMLGSLFGAMSYLLKTPKIDLPIVSPVVEDQCKINPDCLLVYVDDYVCLPWDTSVEKYKCLNSDEAEIFGGKKIDLSVMCSIPEVKFDRYVCKCANGKCKKVKIEEVEEVIITTDKMEYEIGKEVKITIENNSNEQKMSYPSYVIEMFENNIWTHIKQIRRPCGMVYEEIGLVTIKPGDKLEYEWNQEETECSEPVDQFSSKMISNQVFAGKYRVSSRIFGSRLLDGNIIYSNEFTIKEETELDSRCSEKVKGIGTCDRYNKGYAYEFDSEIEKCVEEDGVTGCSFEIPFRTLKECQKVCEKRECAKEGEFINYPQGTNENLQDVCCEGLKGLLGYRIENDKCEILLGGPFLTCMPCGNGICETINNFDENKCNCPEDCK